MVGGLASGVSVGFKVSDSGFRVFAPGLGFGFGCFDSVFKLLGLGYVMFLSFSGGLGF